MELQFVFGNPIKKKGGKKPLPKHRGNVKLSSSAKKGKAMAKRKTKKKTVRKVARKTVRKVSRKPAKRRYRNPMVAFADTRVVDTDAPRLKRLGVVATDSELSEMRSHIAYREGKLMTAKKRADAAKKKKALIEKRYRDLKKFVSGAGKTSKAITAALNKSNRPATFGNRMVYTQPELALENDDFFNSISKKGKAMKKKARKTAKKSTRKSAKRKTHKRRNPVLDLSGIDFVENPKTKKAKKAKKATKKVAKRKTRKGKKAYSATLSKGLWKRVRKLKKGKTMKPRRGVTIRRNPTMNVAGIDLGFSTESLMNLAIAGAVTPVANSLFQGIASKVPVVGKVINHPALKTVSIAPMLMGILMINAKKISPKLAKLQGVGEAMVASAIMSTAANTVGGRVVGMLKPYSAGFLAGDSAESLGLLPAGMEGVELHGDADFGGVELHGDADFGSDADFGGIPEGMEGVELHGDADFGGDDIGEDGDDLSGDSIG